MIDYRENKHRRKVFLDFYEYHLRNRGHAGAVYYAFPHIFDTLNMNIEEKLWFAFINGCSQNVLTTYLIYKNFPDIHNLDMNALTEFYRENYKRIGWDTDRKWEKNKFEKIVQSYKDVLGDKTQEEFFNQYLTSEDPYVNFDTLWDVVNERFMSFGRLSTFSYLEYLKIVGLNIDCSRLFLEDISGSKSHRNGICKVIGRDDLEWTKTNHVTYDADLIKTLTEEGESLLEEAKATIDHPDVSYFTLETTLCCYKGWHRVNRRYPNVYNDMFYTRIRFAESGWPEEDFSIFWDARRSYLDEDLRLEDNLLDRGLCKEKQNYYRLTGTVIMMEKEGYKVPKDKPWLRYSVMISGDRSETLNKLFKSRNPKKLKIGGIALYEADDIIFVGNYDEGVEVVGCDSLGSYTKKDFNNLLSYVKGKKKLVIFDGDSFLGEKKVKEIDPVLLRVGSKGKLPCGYLPHKESINSTETIKIVEDLACLLTEIRV